MASVLADGLARAANADDGTDRAVDAGLVYTADLWRHVEGGIERGSAYLDNVDATLTLDADTLWGWKDTTVFLYGLYNNGHPLSSNRVGDLQAVSNIETGVSATRLYEAWIEAPIREAGSLRAGLYDLNSEFDVLDSASLFLHSAHGIGSDIGLSGRNGPSIFPVTSLALRLEWEWTALWQSRLAVLDGVPGDPEHPGRTRVSLSSDDGALVVAELERSNAESTLLLGAWGYTSRFSEWSDGASPARTSRGNAGAYLRGEAALGSSPLTAFARIGTARARYNPFGLFVGGGIVWQGPLANRPADSLGLAVAWGEASSGFRDAAPGGSTGADAREVAVELTYRFALGRHLVVQPDLQYVINPGLNPDSDDALTVGLRVVVTLAP